VPERVTGRETSTCGFCEEPFTLNPNDNRYTTTEWADDGRTAVPISACVKCAAQKMAEREAEPPWLDLPTITYIDASLEQWPWFLEHPDDLAEEWTEQTNPTSGGQASEERL
jgi:hypothetical protein